MAVTLLLNETDAAAISPVAPVRPAKSNFYPLTTAIEGTITAGTVYIESSPTQELNDWVVESSATSVTSLPALGHIDYPRERIRARTSADFVGDVSVFLVPGA